MAHRRRNHRRSYTREMPQFAPVEGQRRLKIYRADQHPLTAYQQGDCHFCGRPISEHQPGERDAGRAIPWFDPKIGRQRYITLPIRMNIHHIVFEGVGGVRKTAKWLDPQNTIWVPATCHDKYHQLVTARRNELFRKSACTPWTIDQFEQVVKALNYGRLTLANKPATLFPQILGGD